MGLWKTTLPFYIPTSSSLNENAPEQLRPLQLFCPFSEGLLSTTQGALTLPIER